MRGNKADLPLKRPVPLPPGLDLASIEAVFRSYSVNNEPQGHLDAYVEDSLWRFLHTWGLVQHERGQCLEIGANPYFTTLLLDQYTDLALTLTNYYGETTSETTTETLRYRNPKGEAVEKAFTSQLVNVEREKFPFEDDAFDVLLFCEVIEHLLMDPLAALREINRVLRPGGRLVLTTPNVNRLDNVISMIAGTNVYDPYSGYGPYGRHNREYNRDELTRLLEFAGFEIELSFTADAHPSAAELDPRYEDAVSLVRFRGDDLGHYLFIRARSTGQPREGLPAFLYRSWPPGVIVEDRYKGPIGACVGCTPRSMPEQPPSGHEPLVDVEQLVDDLRERVERGRAVGRDDDVSSLQLEPLDGQPLPAVGDSGASAVAGSPQVVYRPEVGYSSRPVIGPVLTGVKRIFYRLFFYPLDDLAHQTNAAVHHLQARSERAEEAVGTVQALRERIDTLANQLELAHRLTAESLGRDVQSLAERLADLEATQERLQVQSRLGRLERLVRTSPQPAPSRETVESPATAVRSDQEPPSFDYMTFENRFRPEKSVRERQSDYLELLATRKRVVDLGCGRGELLELLGEADVSAYGVEIDPDNVAVCREKGLEVVQGDAVSHLEGLEESAVDGIVASHVIEHLKPDVLWRLVAAAAEKLDEDGILILETPNPESLLAGSINFHRDPTHVRPVHPDTISFLCESAGFSGVEIRRLAPVPADVRLPQRPPDENPVAGHVSEVVEQLNELIYGYQDYALIARL